MSSCSLISAISILVIYHMHLINLSVLNLEAHGLSGRTELTLAPRMASSSFLKTTYIQSKGRCRLCGEV